MGVVDHMADLAGGAGEAVMQFAVDNDPAANACSREYPDDVLVPFTCAATVLQPFLTLTRGA